MKKLLKLHLPALLLMLVLFNSCAKEYSGSGWATPKEDYNLVINFTPVVDTLKLSFDSTYKNYFDEPFKVAAFKFYICQFDLINTDSNRVYNVNKDKYFLIDAADSTTWTVKLSAVPFRYNRISFTIGVDSSRNVSGAQTGSLDPVKGMFWTWNSGYIMAKLEGTSPLSNQPNGKFEYHIGGFKGIENAIRKPLLLFPFGVYSEIKPNTKSIISVNANVNAWFYNPHDLKIEENPVVTTPGILARSVSENYSKMFTVTAVKNE